jgi:transcriptional antiterminator RfaH
MINDDALWTAVHLKSRCEKQVRDHCERNEIACYLPLVRKVKRYQRRNVETFLPMFPGYMFVQLGPGESTTLLKCHRVVHILHIDKEREGQLVEELRALQILEKAALEAHLVAKPELVPGKMIEVTSGPCAGLCGIVERRQGKTRVTVNVELLGQSVSMEVDANELDELEA